MPSSHTGLNAPYYSGRWLNRTSTCPRSSETTSLSSLPWGERPDRVGEWELEAVTEAGFCQELPGTLKIVGNHLDSGIVARLPFSLPLSLQERCRSFEQALDNREQTGTGKLERSGSSCTVTRPNKRAYSIRTHVYRDEVQRRILTGGSPTITNRIPRRL